MPDGGYRGHSLIGEGPIAIAHARYFSILELDFLQYIIFT